jgi:hypothetical protein
MADAPQLTLCPDASLRTKMVAASTARAQIRPSGIARLTSRVVFYTRDIEDRSYASGYVDTYIPPAGQADQFFLPRYTGFREATIFRTAGDAIVIGVTASDQMYIQDDHNEMFRIVNDPAAGTGGRDRLLRSPHTKGPAISNWAAVKKECLESMDDIVTQEEDGVYVKPARTGIKIVTLRQEFDDASQDGTPTKTVLVRSPAMNQRKGVTIDDLVGTTVNMICLIKYRVVLNLKGKKSALRQDIHVHAVYETEQASNGPDNDPAVEGFERSADYEDQLSEIYSTPQRGNRPRDENDES